MRRIFFTLLSLTAVLLMSFAWYRKRPVKMFLIGDSTVADYTLEPGYMASRYPLTGWGQVLQPLLNKRTLIPLKGLVRADSVTIDDRAKGGRSTRTFFQEGRWSSVYRDLQKGDLVLIQFGHNDSSKEKTERYVDIEGYKEFLRLFVNQTREKGAVPVLITPVTRNYPWIADSLGSAHGDYPQAMKVVAGELNVALIDLTSSSAALFSRKGKEYVSSNYFMNLPPDKFPAYKNGQTDNTHFQPEGAKVVAEMVYEGLKSIAQNKLK